MVSVEVDKNKEQQHEAGMDTVIQDPPPVSDGDNNVDAQVENEANTLEANSITPVELQEEPRTDDSPKVVELSEGEDQSNTDEIGSLSTIEAAPQEVDTGEEGQSSAPLASSSLGDPETERKPIEATNVETERNPAEEMLQASVKTDKLEVLPGQETKDSESTNQSNGGIHVAGTISTALFAERVEVVNNKQQVIGETKPQDENSPSDADAADQEDTELASQQSSESLPAKPSGFLESLTANFAPDTKAMWAQIFGPRYEDEDQGWQDDNQSNAESTSTRESVASKSSLQAKLARERKLDEQIQASQRRYRERVLRNAAANNTATRRGRVKSSGQSHTQAPVISPLEHAGFSLTQIRFCTEKALDETCKCFRHLHAVALEEDEDLDSSPTQGIYITQGELDQLLQELFDPQEPSKTRSRRGTLAVPLDFTGNGGASFVEGISMNTQLQASWFIPFGQLPHLRSMVMKITKRHLNEEKLAIVNRHLQKQLTLLPLSTKLQNLVLQLSNLQLKDPLMAPIWPEGNRSSDQVAQDLLGCIAVNEAAVSAEYNNFLHFVPFELVSKMQLSSVVCAQRLVFFRYLIDIIAAERVRLHSNSTKSFRPALSDKPSPKRKSLGGKRRSSSKRISVESDATTQDDDNPADSEETTSVRTTHGSLHTTSEAGGVNNETLAENDLFEHPDQVGDESEKPASQLQQQLESAINQLRQTLPTIDSDTSNPAIRATYLAAVACHQSVLLMLDNNIDVDSTMSDKLKHFIEALQAIQIKTSVQIIPVVAENADNQLVDPPRFPPPYPESTVPEEDDEDSESGIVKTIFPPPYEITTPSYWTFNPSIPEPKSSIAKLASKSPSSKPAELRSHFMAKKSPGVGAYNIQQSEKLTFEQKPSYSFGAGGESFIGGIITPGSTLNALRHSGSIGKPSSKLTPRQRTKTSLAFVPPMDNEWSTDTTRAHVGSQYDDSHLGTSSCDELPPYNQDTNGTYGEKHNDDAIEDVETEMDRALRLQQRIFMNEFVQQVVSKQGSPTFVPRDKINTENTQRSSSKSKPYWATCEVSPGIERLLHRQRRAPSSSKFRPPPASTAPVRPRTSRTTKRVVIKAPPSPPRRQLDNDQHLAWAARISELYQPTVSEQ